MDDQEQLIQQLQADKDQLTAKLEALQTEYDQSVANLKISEDKVKNSMVENQRLLIGFGIGLLLAFDRMQNESTHCGNRKNNT